MKRVSEALVGESRLWVCRLLPRVILVKQLSGCMLHKNSPEMMLVEQSVAALKESPGLLSENCV